MDDLISRQAAIDVIASLEAVGNFPYATIGRLDALLALNRLPSAVRHGRWADNVWVFTCSECGNDAGEKWDYCPHCGAKMDEEEVKNERI